jgi:hypothetical protein
LVKMFNNQWRALMIYDEGDGLCKALKNGENATFSAPTMAKLHNGAGITRDVQKDQHKVHMPRSCLNLCLGCHYEEYAAFTGSPDVIGMGPRIQGMHQTGTLCTGMETMDHGVYAEALHVQRPPAEPRKPILLELHDTLVRMEKKNDPSSPGYDTQRHFRPEYLCNEAVGMFCQRFDKLTASQEQAYLTQPKLFSRCGKFKSVPWRWALVLSKWEEGAGSDVPLVTGVASSSAAPVASNTQEAKQEEASKDEASTAEGHVACVTGPASMVALELFDDFFYRQAAVLHPHTDLKEWLRDAPVREEVRTRFPLLFDYITNGRETVQQYIAQHRSSAPTDKNSKEACSDLSFETGWKSQGADEKKRIATVASYILTRTTLGIVRHTDLVKKMRGQLLANKATAMTALNSSQRLALGRSMDLSRTAKWFSSGRQHAQTRLKRALLS